MNPVGNAETSINFGVIGTSIKYRTLSFVICFRKRYVLEKGLGIK